jgi:hypothetical protein
MNKSRLITIALAVVAVALVKKFVPAEYNPLA